MVECFGLLCLSGIASSVSSKPYIGNSLAFAEGTIFLEGETGVCGVRSKHEQCRSCGM